MVAQIVGLQKQIKERTSQFAELNVPGLKTPVRSTWSGELVTALQGQIVVIQALVQYKHWKLDIDKTNSDTWKTLRDEFYKHNKIIASVIDLIKPK